MTALGVMETISRKRLAELEAKERAHDAYRAACRYMEGRPGEWTADNPVEHGWRAGYRACLRDFSEAILAADRERD